MSDFYTPPTDIPAVSRAKSLQINELKDSVEAGFDAVEAELNGYMADITTAETNAEDSATASANSASAAADSATEAADSATEADGYATALYGTSSTSVEIGTGGKTFTVESGKKFAQGQFVSIISDADSENYMHGAVTSYSGTTLVVDITNIGGSSTYSDWSIGLAGTQGPQGAAGLDGYMTYLYTVNATAASEVIFDDQIDSTYKKYIIECNNASGGGSLSVVVGYGSTPTYLTSSYLYTLRKQDYSTTSLIISKNEGTAVQASIGTGGTATFPYHVRIELYDPSEPYVHPIYSQIHRHGIGYNGFAAQNSSTILTAIKIISSTTITGTFKLYGVL